MHLAIKIANKSELRSVLDLALFRTRRASASIGELIIRRASFAADKFTSNCRLVLHFRVNHSSRGQKVLGLSDR